MIIWCVLLVSLSFLPVLLTQTPNTTIPNSEYLGLLDIYNATDGDHWIWRDEEIFGPKWFHDSNYPCNTPEWQGLACECDDEDLCNIVAISLRGYRLKGSLPSSIGNFPVLSRLELSRNKLSSSIPTSLINLTDLRDLDLHDNKLSGSIPKELFINKFKLHSLDFHRNNLSSSIPTTVGLLNNSKYVDFSFNSLTGSLPTTIGNMTELRILYASYNNISGTLPESFYYLRKLQRCFLNDNALSGSLSHHLGKLHSLIDIQLYVNKLTGSIPTSIGKLTHLKFLFLYFNHMNGSLPAELFTLTNLTTFALYYNHFSGSILPSIGNLTNLQGIALYGNRLTGTVPATISNLQYLRNLEIYNNSLTGTFPAELCECSSLGAIYMQNNSLSGSIPDCFFAGNVQVLELFDNQLTGTIPQSMGPSLVSLLLYNNQLSGELPTKCEENLTFIDVSNNYFTGRVSETLLVNASFQQFVLSHNLLSNSVPSLLGSLLELLYLDISSNIFSQFFPVEVSNLELLQVLFIENNRFSGPIDFVNPSVQLFLINIDISGNQFTGTIPDSVFSLPSLGSFAAVSNCIKGSISDAICNAKNLTAIAIDGLHTASSCRITLLPLISNSYALSYYTPGTIPPCLFNMRQLATLHASGNGLVGSLPNDLIVGSALFDLSLSHNQLSGEIPPGIGYNLFTSLDLSYNRLIGELPRGPTPDNMTLYYDVNRLSGPIPSQMENIRSINILNGNHFTCGTKRSTIPHNDPQHKYYECGANTVQYTLYTWCGLFSAGVIAFTALIISAVRRKEVTETGCWPKIYGFYSTLVLWNSFYKKDQPSAVNIEDIKNAGKFWVALRRVLMMIFLVLSIVILPCNVILSSLYATYQSQYAWIVGSVYLSGTPATIVLFIVLVLFITYTVFRLTQIVSSNVETSATITVTLDDKLKRRRYVNYLLLSLIGLVNFAVILTMNVIFVVIVTRYNTSIITFTELLFAAFKLIWNDIILRRITYLLHKYYWKGIILSTVEEMYWQKVYLQFNLFSMLLNVLLIPCLATAAVSPDCINNVLIPPDKVVSTFEYQSCITYLPQVELAVGHCVAFQSESSSTSYLPPFVYSYQCSATLVSTYAVVYLYKFLFISFGLPLLLWMESNFPSSWRTHSQVIVPNIYKIDAELDPSNRVIFCKERFILRITMYLSVLVTFGTIFSPLGITACVAVVIQAYLVQINIGRLALKWITLESVEKLTVLNSDCVGIDGLFKQSLPVLGPAAGLFYSFIIFDTYGDEVGGFKALPLLIAMISIGIIIGVFFNSFAFQKLLRRERRQGPTGDVIELYDWPKIDQSNPIQLKKEELEL